MRTRGTLTPAEVTGVNDDGGGQSEVSFDGGAGDADDAVAIVVLRRADGSLQGIHTRFARGDGSAAVPVAYADREVFVFHALAYQPGDTPADTVVALNSALGFDDEGDPVICTAADRQAALTAAAQAPPEPETEGALI